MTEVATAARLGSPNPTVKPAGEEEQPKRISPFHAVSPFADTNSANLLGVNKPTTGFEPKQRSRSSQRAPGKRSPATSMTSPTSALPNQWGNSPINTNADPLPIGALKSSQQMANSNATAGLSPSPQYLAPSSPISGAGGRLSVFKQRDLVARARELLAESPSEALKILEQLAGMPCADPLGGTSHSQQQQQHANHSASTTPINNNGGAADREQVGSVSPFPKAASTADLLQQHDESTAAVTGTAAVGSGGGSAIARTASDAAPAAPSSTVSMGSGNVFTATMTSADGGVGGSSLGNTLVGAGGAAGAPAHRRSHSSSMSRQASAPVGGVIDDPSVVAQALFIRGLCLGNMHRNEDSYTTADDLILRFPSRSEGHYLKGLALYALDFPEEDSREAFGKGYALDREQHGDEKVRRIQRNVEAALKAQRLARFKIGLVRHIGKVGAYEQPHCARCDTLFVNPTLGWFCPHCMRDEFKCGKRELVRVWQPDDEGLSEGCACCGKRLGGPLAALMSKGRLHHCRCCGKVVCGTCSSQKSAVDALLIKTPERVCDKCFVKLDSSQQRCKSPIQLRALTDDELGVYLGCAPTPSVGRVGQDLSGMVAEYASPVVVRSATDSSFCEVDHKTPSNLNGNNSNARSGGIDYITGDSSHHNNNKNNNNSSFASSSGGGDNATKSNSSTSRSSSSASTRQHRRPSNVHTCVKSSFEQQLWTTTALAAAISAGGGGGVSGAVRANVNASPSPARGRGYSSASAASMPSSSIHLGMAAVMADAQDEAEGLLAKFMLPFQDVYSED